MAPFASSRPIIVLATGNLHKIRELRQLFRLPGIRWRSLADDPTIAPIDETGRTFEENAILKARAAAAATGQVALADDSGLEVDALGGAPGVQSARFAGAHGDTEANTKKLLRLLRGVAPAHRLARYRCVLALADPSRLIATTQGVWHGWIAERPAGRGGFGYDPIVRIAREGPTVAQLPSATKQRLSHRAMAARRMRVVHQRWLRLKRTGE